MAKLIKEAARFYMAINRDLSHHYHTICQHLLPRFPDLKDAITLPGASINYVSIYFIIIIYYMAKVNSVKIVRLIADRASFLSNACEHYEIFIALRWKIYK